MLGLPNSTHLNKPLPKKAFFEKFHPSAADRRLFDEQISRMAIVAEISPQTVALAAGDEVTAIYVILVTLKTPACDKRNIALLSKLIDQSLLFALHYEQSLRLAVYRARRVLLSESKPVDGWALTLSGLNLDAVWTHMIARIAGIELAEGKSLDESIFVAEQRARLEQQIAALEKRTRGEDQPRRKREHFEQLQNLKRDLERLSTP